MDFIRAPHHRIVSIFDMTDNNYELLKRVKGYPKDFKFQGTIEKFDTDIPAAIDDFIEIGLLENPEKSTLTSAGKLQLEDFNQRKNEIETAEYRSGFTSIKEAFVYKIFSNQLVSSKAISNWDVLVSVKSFDLRLPQSLKLFDLELKSAAVFAIIFGQGIDKVTSHFIDIFKPNVEFQELERLIILAVNYIIGQTSLNTYKNADVPMYTILTALDCSTCEKCGEMDGKLFKLSEAKVGETYPPFCDHCRCTTVAYYPGDKNTGTRIARNPETGKNYKVPADLTYEQWRKEVAEKYGKDILEKAQRQYLNLKNDIAEQRAMQKVLGNKVPSKIADFQRVKYNELKKWKRLKDNYEVFKNIAESDIPEIEKRQLKKEYIEKHIND